MLKEGDKVMVRVSSDVTGKTVKKFNGQISTISRISGWVHGQCYYELKDIESDTGIPYSFVESWLQPVE